MECNVCKLCVRLIVCLFVCPSVRLSVCPSVCLSVCVCVTGRLPACANVVCMLVCCMYNLYQTSSMNVSNMCLYNPQKTSACHVSNSGGAKNPSLRGTCSACSTNFVPTCWSKILL